MRYCAEIGMFAIDRGIPESCVHATAFCKGDVAGVTPCYNLKLYRLYPAMRGADARINQEWAAISGADIARQLARKRKPIDRLRLMTRGEAFSALADVDRVEDIARENPRTLIWIPTRAWRAPLLRSIIESRIAPLDNVSVLASMDPTNTEAEWRDLVSAGWSTMFYGRMVGGWNGPPDSFRCPKTWRNLKGHCGVCKAGCFAPKVLGRRVDVHLGFGH